MRILSVVVAGEAGNLWISRGCPRKRCGSHALRRGADRAACQQPVRPRRLLGPAVAPGQGTVGAPGSPGPPPPAQDQLSTGDPQPAVEAETGLLACSERISLNGLRHQALAAVARITRP